jgi:hypothetical protein
MINFDKIAMQVWETFADSQIVMDDRDAGYRDGFSKGVDTFLDALRAEIKKEGERMKYSAQSPSITVTVVNNHEETKPTDANQVESV